jgi:NDP-sugar pyrophosphorylase family protein
LTSAVPRCAIVLTAGIGTRLRPLTCVRAKPAVPVAGEALARRILRGLADQGIRETVLNLHYRPETIAAAVGDGRDLGLSVRYSWEPAILGSAGGPRVALSLLGADRALVLNGDTLTDLDLGSLARAHTASGALVTMALVENPDPARYGGVELDERGVVRGFTAPGAAVPSYHFIGVQIVEAEAFAGVPADRASSSVGELYPTLMRTRPGSIHGVPSTARFEDVGTPADYLATSLTVAAREGRRASLVGRACRIDGSSTIERSVLWDEVIVEADCELVECIVADRVRVPARTRLRRAALVLQDGPPVRGERRFDGVRAVPLDAAPEQTAARR